MVAQSHSNVFSLLSISSSFPLFNVSCYNRFVFVSLSLSCKTSAPPCILADGVNFTAARREEGNPGINVLTLSFEFLLGFCIKIPLCTLAGGQWLVGLSSVEEEKALVLSFPVINYQGRWRRSIIFLILMSTPVIVKESNPIPPHVFLASWTYILRLLLLWWKWLLIISAEAHLTRGSLSIATLFINWSWLIFQRCFEVFI
jgi:hypothetical protein